MNGAFTTRLKVVVLLTKQGLKHMPVTVMTEVPMGVDAVVLIVSVVEQVGLQLVWLKAAVAPLGSPEAEKFTVCVGLPVRVAVIIVLPEAPGVTVTSPEFPSVKLNVVCASAVTATSSPLRTARNKSDTRSAARRKERALDADRRITPHPLGRPAAP